MTQYNTHPLGNPVDHWWLETRQNLNTCIDMLAQYPPASNSITASEMIPAVRRAKTTIQQNTVPTKAQHIHQALMECLTYLETSLREQAAHGIIAKDRNYNRAYHQFLMVIYYLMQRGIYEPQPTEYRQNRVS